MSDRPIIFSAPMVRALIDGRKTMTRRLARSIGKPKVIRGRPHTGFERASPWCDVKVGDQLWVREAGRSYFKRGRNSPGWIYRADCNEFTGNKLIHQIGATEIKWTPSIHMPRWASRLTLTVTAVRIERLTKISNADALAEGVKVPGKELAFPAEAFKDLWASLHGMDSWDSNPDVVVLTFTVAERNIDSKRAA